MIKYTKEQIEKAEKLVRVNVKNGVLVPEEGEIINVLEDEVFGSIIIASFANCFLEELGNIRGGEEKEWFVCLPEDLDFMVKSYKEIKTKQKLELIKQKEAEIEQLKKEIALMSAE